jgi:hypothetical protein
LADFYFSKPNKVSLVGQVPAAWTFSMKKLTSPVMMITENDKILILFFFAKCYSIIFKKTGFLNCELRERTLLRENKNND